MRCEDLMKARMMQEIVCICAQTQCPYIFIPFQRTDKPEDRWGKSQAKMKDGKVESFYKLTIFHITVYVHVNGPLSKCSEHCGHVYSANLNKFYV